MPPLEPFNPFYCRTGRTQFFSPSFWSQNFSCFIIFFLQEKDFSSKCWTDWSCFLGQTKWFVNLKTLIISFPYYLKLGFKWWSPKYAVLKKSMKKITEISDLRSHFLQSFLSSKSDTFMHMSFLNFCQLLRYLCLVFYKHVKTGHSKMHRKDLLPAF